MEKKDRKIGRIALTVLGFTVFVCLGILVVQKNDKEQQIPENMNENITLEVYAWADEEVNVRLLADTYMEQNPDIIIHENIIPISEYRQRMLSLKNGKYQADCVFSPSPAEAVVWKNRGILKKLDDYFGDSDWKSRYEDWYSEGEEEYASYMIPYRTSRWAVYYNKSLFDKMGVDYPQEGWTWKDYEDTAVKLTGWVDGKKTYGSLSFEPESIWWRVPARTAGANDPFIKSDLEAFRESAEFIYHLTYDLGAQPSYTEQDSRSGFEYDATFLKGNIGMYFSGDWSVPVLNQAIEEAGMEFAYDIAPMPHWEGRKSYMISDAAVVSMLEATEHPEEVFDFMSFVAGEKGASILAANSVIPALITPEIQDMYLQAGQVPEHLSNFFVEGEVSRVPVSVRYSEGMELVKREVSRYLLQKQNIEQTYDNIEKGLDEIW